MYIYTFAPGVPQKLPPWIQDSTKASLSALRHHADLLVIPQERPQAPTDHPKDAPKHGNKTTTRVFTMLSHIA